MDQARVTSVPIARNPVRLTILPCLLLTAAAMLALPGHARQAPGAAVQADVTITKAERQQTIDAMVKDINAFYVFPELASKVEAAMKKHQKEGRYDKFNSERELAIAVTNDLLALTGDKHLRLRYSDTATPVQGPARQPTAEELARQLAQIRSENFGIERVERLPLNIGYLELNEFATVKHAAESLTAAMTLLAHTDALIIDLRNNGGGDPATLTYVASYLLERRTHISDLYSRQGNRTDQFWSLDVVPGLRFGEKKPVYLLTSSETFSAAEGFSYALQALRRATVVGETTRGGAHPGRWMRLTPHLSVFVPRARAIDPRTGGNWEGTGVKPDMKVPAPDALRTAQLTILQAMATSEQDAAQRSAIAERIARLTAEAQPSTAPAAR